MHIYNHNKLLCRPILASLVEAKQAVYTPATLFLNPNVRV